MLIIEFVKITIESMSPQIMWRETRRHKIFMWCILGFLFSLLIAQGVLDQEGYKKTNTVLEIVYTAVISSLCVRFIWIVKFFVDKKSSQN